MVRDGGTGERQDGGNGVAPVKLILHVKGEELWKRMMP